jgi:hypothetical protein
MRRLIGSAVLFAVLSLTVPSYGNYYLIYNMSANVKGVDYNYLHEAVTIPLKGYLLLTLSDSNIFIDTNMVLYGKDTDGAKKYVELGYNGDNLYFSNSYMWRGYGYFGVVIDGGYVFGFRGQLIGKMTLKDVGLGATTKKNVASSLKGVLNVEEGMLLDARQDIAGTSTISMSLNSVYTKGANGNDPVWDANSLMNGQEINGINRGIKPDLQAKGYADATPM